MLRKSYHIPVMLDKVVEFLDVAPGGLYIDCTLGGGGHSRAILEKGGRVIGIDRDSDAVDHAVKYLSRFRSRFSAHVARFSTIAAVARTDVGTVNGVLMDLGVSSKMIDDPSRGFSYRYNGPLLMSMDGSDKTAYEVINKKTVHELSAIFRKYGEERKAKKIAEDVVKARSSHPIETTTELANIIENAVGPRMPQKSKARIFQALRIYVNDELDELQCGLDEALDVLSQGGRLCVISYNSLEDRIVKDFMKRHARPCVCPPDLPECRCGLIPDLKLITRKAVRPLVEEIESNPRARSARLRAAEKVGVS